MSMFPMNNMAFGAQPQNMGMFPAQQSNEVANWILNTANSTLSGLVYNAQMNQQEAAAIFNVIRENLQTYYQFLMSSTNNNPSAASQEVLVQAIGGICSHARQLLVNQQNAAATRYSNAAVGPMVNNSGGGYQISAFGGNNSPINPEYLRNGNQGVYHTVNNGPAVEQHRYNGVNLPVENYTAEPVRQNTNSVQAQMDALIASANSRHPTTNTNARERVAPVQQYDEPVSPAKRVRVTAVPEVSSYLEKKYTGKDITYVPDRATKLDKTPRHIEIPNTSAPSVDFTDTLKPLSESDDPNKAILTKNAVLTCKMNSYGIEWGNLGYKTMSDSDAKNSYGPGDPEDMKSYVMSKIPEHEFIFNNGYSAETNSITRVSVRDGDGVEQSTVLSVGLTLPSIVSDEEDLINTITDGTLDKSVVRNMTNNTTRSIGEMADNKYISLTYSTTDVIQVPNTTMKQIVEEVDRINTLNSVSSFDRWYDEITDLLWDIPRSQSETIEAFLIDKLNTQFEREFISYDESLVSPPRISKWTNIGDIIIHRNVLMFKTDTMNAIKSLIMNVVGGLFCASSVLDCDNDAHRRFIIANDALNLELSKHYRAPVDMDEYDEICKEENIKTFDKLKFAFGKFSVISVPKILVFTDVAPTAYSSTGDWLLSHRDDYISVFEFLNSIAGKESPGIERNAYITKSDGSLYVDPTALFKLGVSLDGCPVSSAALS